MVHLAMRGTKREGTEGPCSLGAHLSPPSGRTPDPPALLTAGTRTPAAGGGPPIASLRGSAPCPHLVGWAQTQSIPRHPPLSFPRQPPPGPGALGEAPKQRTPQFPRALWQRGAAVLFSRHIEAV